MENNVSAAKENKQWSLESGGAAEVMMGEAVQNITMMLSCTWYCTVRPMTHSGHGVLYSPTYLSEIGAAMSLLEYSAPFGVGAMSPLYHPPEPAGTASIPGSLLPNFFGGVIWTLPKTWDSLPKMLASLLRSKQRLRGRLLCSTTRR